MAALYYARPPRRLDPATPERSAACDRLHKCAASSVAWPVFTVEGEIGHGGSLGVRCRAAQRTKACANAVPGVDHPLRHRPDQGLPLVPLLLGPLLVKDGRARFNHLRFLSSSAIICSVTPTPAAAATESARCNRPRCASFSILLSAINSWSASTAWLYRAVSPLWASFFHGKQLRGVFVLLAGFLGYLIVNKGRQTVQRGLLRVGLFLGYRFAPLAVRRLLCLCRQFKPAVPCFPRISRISRYDLPNLRIVSSLCAAVASLMPYHPPVPLRSPRAVTQAQCRVLDALAAKRFDWLLPTVSPTSPHRQ